MEAELRADRQFELCSAGQTTAPHLHTISEWGRDLSPGGLGGWHGGRLPHPPNATLVSRPPPIPTLDSAKNGTETAVEPHAEPRVLRRLWRPGKIFT